jgi:hypothetical protein
VRVTLLPSGPVPVPELSIWSVLVRRSALIEAVPLDLSWSLATPTVTLLPSTSTWSPWESTVIVT